MSATNYFTRVDTSEGASGGTSAVKAKTHLASDPVEAAAATFASKNRSRDESGTISPSALALPLELQNALNPPAEIRIEWFGWTFCPSDKVMRIENDYDKEVYDDDLGVVSRIDMEEGALAVDFEGRELVYSFGELDELMLAFAMTIPQEPKLGIPDRGDPADDAALCDAAAEPGLPGSDPG